MIAATPRRFWTDAERDILRRLYPKSTAPKIAKRLGRPVHSIFNQVYKLGITKSSRTITDDAFAERVRELNSQGYSDQGIADAINCERHTVSRWRKRLSLPCNAHSERQRAKTRAKTAEQCARAGVKSLGQVRALALQKRAVDAGWPSDLRIRAVQILELLSVNGPMTRLELCEAMGLNWCGSRASLKSKDPGGSYLAILIARGLVISLGKVVSPGGRGKNQQLYSLALTAERRCPDGAA